MSGEKKWRPHLAFYSTSLLYICHQSCYCLHSWYIKTSPKNHILQILSFFSILENKSQKINPWVFRIGVKVFVKMSYAGILVTWDSLVTNKTTTDLYNTKHTIQKKSFSCTQLPLQVNLSLWCRSFRFCFFLLFWYLATDWISCGCCGRILGRCWSLPAPSGPSYCCSSSLFIWCSYTRSIFRGSTASWFIGRGLWPSCRVWRHAVLCAVTRRSSTLLPAGLSGLLLKERKKKTLRDDRSVNM